MFCHREARATGKFAHGPFPWACLLCGHGADHINHLPPGQLLDLESGTQGVVLETHGWGTWLWISNPSPHEVKVEIYTSVPPSAAKDINEVCSLLWAHSPPPQALQISAEAVWHFWGKVGADPRLCQSPSSSLAEALYRPVQRKIQPITVIEVFPRLIWYFLFLMSLI